MYGILILIAIVLLIQLVQGLTTWPDETLAKTLAGENGNVTDAYIRLREEHQRQMLQRIREIVGTLLIPMFTLVAGYRYGRGKS